MAATAIAVGVALAPTTVAGRVPPSAGEEAQRQADPGLYAAAWSYFPGSGKVELDVPPPKRIFRLTRDQFDATVEALLPGVAAKSVKDRMARDPLQTNYEYAEMLGVNASNFAALSGWIGEVAGAVRKSPERAVACPGDKPAESCLKDKARAFVVKAFRGDAAAEKVDRVVAFYLAGVKSAGFAQATGDLVEVVLNSPDFVFRKELAVEKADARFDKVFRREFEVDGNTGHLASRQLLPTLTYTLADAPPSKLGLEPAKADQHLKDDAAVQATVARIVASDDARAKLVRFFMAWLEVRQPAEFTISKKVFPEFDEKLAQAMVAETEQFLKAKLAAKSPRLKDITQATDSFVSKPMAEIYGTKAADPAGGQPVKLDARQRLGIFSQPAVLASHSGPTDTRPIKRGTFWVRKAMCMEMGDVPPGLDISIKPLANVTERKKIEASTAARACVGCHKLIDPLGFFQEHYDALGRWRTKENGLPIDASIAVDFLDQDPTKPDAGPVKLAGPVEALKALTGSLMFKQCFVRQMFRFYMGRNEEPADDPLLRRMFFGFALGDEQDILKLLETLALSDRIAMRR